MSKKFQTTSFSEHISLKKHIFDEFSNTTQYFFLNFSLLLRKFYHTSFKLSVVLIKKKQYRTIYIYITNFVVHFFNCFLETGLYFLESGLGVILPCMQHHYSSLRETRRLRRLELKHGCVIDWWWMRVFFSFYKIIKTK